MIKGGEARAEECMQPCSGIRRLTPTKMSPSSKPL